ncbi:MULTISPECIES: MurR/RpiR family transcriptional regulator [Comamonas]|jgi:DNA-binding MurR/RpiR family transcriptional regulator|uniref:MurR/RpiR family transcriptional regulator n=1 Tax=Comamonas squillarum TaxID=2977320 RepID=A0ABY5ZYL3_9BURK|nr:MULTISPECIES: MurR/RpiR family transcriptional regulator [Comamonas]PWB17263.1 DNA-binding protein [Comamonas sp. JNW]UXC17825.1 MurR/RpiR family transcriptional regulator [Comamonas sp. PR12]
MGVIDQLRDRFASLSPSLQQVARYVLDHPNEVVTQSMRSVGQHAQVPPTTLVRFAQTCGFEGWNPFKQALTADMGLTGEVANAYGERARSLLGRAQDQQLTAEMFAMQRSNLDLTEQHSAARLTAAAQLLETADQVHVMGMRACFPVAFSLVYVYRLFRRSVHLLEGMGGVREMQLRAIDAGDALVAISFAPYSQETVHAVELARARGCKVLALTDSLASPLSLAADETLLFAVNSPSFFPSVTAAQALSESLLEVLVSRAGPQAVARIESAEGELHDSGIYVQPVRK